MAKLPARMNDQVNNSAHGNGSLIEGTLMVTFEGQPIACVGDKAKFADTIEGEVIEGNACVQVNDKRIALVGDKTENSGVIQEGACGIQVDEGDPFVFIGDNVDIGSNVFFNTSPMPFYDLYFLLYNESTGKPLPYISYRINTSKGPIEGITDEEGYTALVSSKNADEVTIEILEELENNQGIDEFCSYFS